MKLGSLLHQKYKSIHLVKAPIIIKSTKYHLHNVAFHFLPAWTHLSVSYLPLMENKQAKKLNPPEQQQVTSLLIIFLLCIMTFPSIKLKMLYLCLQSFELY